MKNIIDIHSHILPGVDDGCKTGAEAIAMLRMYEDQGTEAVICTPHYGPCGITGVDVNGIFNWLQSVGSSVKLFLGNEVHASYLPGSRTLAGSDHILIEFEEWLYHTGEEEMLRLLANVHDYIPVLAHPERYKTIQNNPDFCRKLTKKGIKLQINAYDVVQNKNCAKTTQYLLKNRMVSFIGSDAHGALRRAPELSVGVQWIYDNCPEEYADAIVHDNAEKLIKGGA